MLILVFLFVNVFCRYLDCYLCPIWLVYSFSLSSGDEFYNF